MTREYDFGPEPIQFETPYGLVGVKATGGNQVKVEVEHGNPLTIRGVPVYGSVFLTMTEDGSWEEKYPYTHRTDRTEPSRALQRTMHEVFQEIGRKFFEEHPDLLLAGALSEVNNDLYHKEKEAEKLREQLRALDEEIADLQKIEEDLESQRPAAPRP